MSEKSNNHLNRIPEISCLQEKYIKFIYFFYMKLRFWKKVYNHDLQDILITMSKRSNSIVNRIPEKTES